MITTLIRRNMRAEMTGKSLAVVGAFIALLGAISQPLAAPISCDQPNSGMFSLDQIKEVISTCKPKDADALISLLPTELRKNFTFVYKSGSPEQKSITPLFPRTILFSNDGKLFLTFSGDPTKPDYNKIQFFQSNGPEKPATIGEVEWGNRGKAKVVDGMREQKNCVQCHTSDPKLIWAQYNHWPGVYGSHDDNLRRGTDEFSNYQTFMKSISPGNTRYNKLIFPSTDSDFLTEGRYQSKLDGNLPPYTETDMDGDYQGSNLAFRPNLHLSILATRMDGIRNARLMRKSPNFDRLKDLMIWEGFGCQWFYWTAENTRNSKYPQTSAIMSAIQNKVEELNRQNPRLKPPIKFSFSQKFGYREALDPESLLRNIGFNDVSNWSPQISEPQMATSTDGFYALTNLVASLVVQTDPELKSSFESYGQYEKNFGDPGKQLDAIIPTYYDSYTKKNPSPPKVCIALAAKFLSSIPVAVDSCSVPNDHNSPVQQLAELSQSIVLATNPLENSCVVCHSGHGSTAPVLPFGDPKALAKLFVARPELKAAINRRIRSDGPDQMPVDRHLSDEEIKEISNFLDEISPASMTPPDPATSASPTF